MNKLLQIYVLSLLAFFISGCILPIPHKRTCRAGYVGFVTDAVRGKPITDVTVSLAYGVETNIITRTDFSGRYEVSEKESWHGIMLIGIPMSYSLLPYFTGTSFPTMIKAQADGYEEWLWQPWVNPPEIDNGQIDDCMLDPHHIEMTPIKSLPKNE